MKKSHTLGAVCASVSILISIYGTVASAGVITSGSVYNNTAGEFSAAYSVGYLSDQSGLSSGYVDGVTDFSTYTTSGVTHVTSENSSGGPTWVSSSSPSFPFVLDFDLGIDQSILSLALWNGTIGNDASINNFDVFTSGVADFSASTLVGSFSNPIGVDGPEPVTIFDLADTTGQYVRLQVNSYYGNFCCAGIGEVAFDVSPVPVPAALWLFGSGILGLVGIARRKKSA